MVQHIYFQNEGQKLLGALHRPAADITPRRLGIIMLHGWAGYRIGSHQMFKRLSERAEKEGFIALRFDFRGRGDSEGAAEDANRSTMISDTLAAVERLRQETDLERFALVGNCSGAEVAIGAAPLCENVDTMVLWSAPKVGDDGSQTNGGQKWHRMKHAIGRMLRIQTWQQLFTGKLSWNMIKEALFGRARAAKSDAPETDEKINWRKRFLEFEGEVFFIYGGNDPVAEPSLEYYSSLSRHKGRPFHSHIVEGANHAFYSVAWEQEVIATTLEWIKSRCVEGDARVEAAGGS